LPQPAHFGEYSVEAQSGVATSPLEIFRRALELRKELVTAEEIIWHESSDANVLHFSRANGWHCLTNFGDSLFPLPPELKVIHSSKPLIGSVIAGATTVWLSA
jgi:alpha-glucosidase